MQTSKLLRDTVCSEREDRIFTFFIFLMYNEYEKYNQLYFKEAYMKDKFVGIAKVGEKGQIVIPKEAREMFDIKSGDSIIVLCDKQKGIALLKADVIEDLSDKVFPKEER